MSIKPRLNRFDLTMIVISLVIGMGIFASPAVVAQKSRKRMGIFRGMDIRRTGNFVRSFNFCGDRRKVPQYGWFL